jgi:hypothetical protein
MPEHRGAPWPPSEPPNDRGTCLYAIFGSAVLAVAAWGVLWVFVWLAGKLWGD